MVIWFTISLVGSSAIAVLAVKGLGKHLTDRWLERHKHELAKGQLTCAEQINEAAPGAIYSSLEHERGSKIVVLKKLWITRGTAMCDREAIPPRVV